VVNDRTTNWTAAPCPTAEWAELVHPGLKGQVALDTLWDQLRHILRLDEDDPAAAWRARQDTLIAASQKLTDRRFDALHFEGPGTDLTVGLLPSSSWMAATFETVDGIVHVPNLPSEETFATPDPERVDGVVRASQPLALPGSIVRGLEVEFRGGRAERIEAESGGETLRAICERDEGAARLGEVALVDGEGRIGPLETTFYDTLLDENAASHIAFGRAYEFTVDDEADRKRANMSAIHIDFMIGRPDMTVTGLTADGSRVSVLAQGAWQI
jgi:aminopeptidase